MVKKEINLPVQVNGKLKGTVLIDITLPQEQIQEKALPVAKITANQIKKVIYVPNRIINFII